MITSYRTIKGFRVRDTRFHEDLAYNGDLYFGETRSKAVYEAALSSADSGCSYSVGDAFKTLRAIREPSADFQIPIWGEPGPGEPTAKQRDIMRHTLGSSHVDQRPGNFLGFRNYFNAPNPDADLEVLCKLGMMELYMPAYYRVTAKGIDYLGEKVVLQR